MEIIINKRLASMGYDYLVSSQEENKYSAISEKLLGFFNSSLYSIKKSEPILKIKNKKISWKPCYWIYYSEEKNKFKTISKFKRHFQYKYQKDSYDIYGHSRSWKYSIYKNNKQIGWWDKKTFKWQGDDRFDLILNDDCDEKLIIAFCLILDEIIDIGVTYSENLIDVEGDLNVFKWLYGEIKTFNPEWQPENNENGL